MKTNRKLDIIILLLGGNELSAQELAEKFNVTEKTIYRDIDYIRESGIPIVGKRGVKGGFRVEDKELLRDNNITLKEQHKLMKLLKNQDRIPEEQLDEIMRSIENLFRDNRINWIEPEFEDTKMNETFFIIKNSIEDCNVLELYFKTNEKQTRNMKIEPYQILIGNNDLYLRFFNLKENNWDKISVNNIKKIIVLNESFIRRTI
ncbi:helix-turn-helix transcriptional regulator [Senegalia sp. (in: firmicutes)]|uniref:helix-turn-helix transcriptional regulator n=1 Tax=Senegalia sp. (in: firmicutes) TaxID=1924098 RepID=UPI003F964C92